MSDMVKQLEDYCNVALNLIGEKFRDGVKITLFVRTPGIPERDFCMSDDSRLAPFHLAKRLLNVDLFDIIGDYLQMKGEDWRTGEGAELNDLYQSLMEHVENEKQC